MPWISWRTLATDRQRNQRSLDRQVAERQRFAATEVSRRATLHQREQPRGRTLGVLSRPDSERTSRLPAERGSLLRLRDVDARDPSDEGRGIRLKWGGGRLGSIPVLLVQWKRQLLLRRAKPRLESGAASSSPRPSFCRSQRVGIFSIAKLGEVTLNHLLASSLSETWRYFALSFCLSAVKVFIPRSALLQFCSPFNLWTPICSRATPQCCFVRRFLGSLLLHTNAVYLDHDGAWPIRWLGFPVSIRMRRILQAVSWKCLSPHEVC